MLLLLKKRFEEKTLCVSIDCTSLPSSTASTLKKGESPSNATTWDEVIRSQLLFHLAKCFLFDFFRAIGAWTLPEL